MIKVNIIGSNHSEGRGVGFYISGLVSALRNIGDVNLTQENPDIIHYPYFDLFYPTLPIIKSRPVVVTIHDVTPLVMADRYPKGLKGNLGLFHQRISLTNVAAVITDSECSKKDIVKYLNIETKKIFVTPLAVDEIFNQNFSRNHLAKIKEKYNLPDKFVLTVSGGPNPNKNLPTLAKVTMDLNIPLIIVGKGMLQEINEPVHEELKDLVELRKYEHIIFPGFVPTEDLAGFYKLASVYCQPSLYEGFGLPLLEAMQSGCLIVSSDTSSLPEIYHQGALTFDPKNIAQMKHVLEISLSISPEEKDKQVKKAKEKAKEFTWKKTAKKTLDIYKKII